MWGQSWGQMLWGAAASAVPAIGPWGVLLIGCVLGILAVLLLRSARKVGLALSLLVLLVPLTALAGVPFIFTAGSIADASQVNANFAAVIPVIGRVQANGSTMGTATTFVFPSTASFTAARDLRCVVTIQPFAVAGSSTARLLWRPAIKVGSTQSVAPLPGQFALSLVRMPFADGTDNTYTSTFTEVFNVTSGSAVSFGARFEPIDNLIYSYTVTAVYSCTPTP